MLDESAVPIAERYVIVEGVVAQSAFVLVKKGLPKRWPMNSVCCFLSFTYADLPLGKTFEQVFLQSDPTKNEETTCVITAATQQFSKPFDLLPHGWKTIAVLTFPNGIPELIRNLPEVEGWHKMDRSTHVLISSQETWRAYVGQAMRAVE